MERSFHKGVEHSLSDGQHGYWKHRLSTNLLFNDKNPVDGLQVVRSKVTAVVDNCNLICEATWLQSSDKAFWTCSLGIKVSNANLCQSCHTYNVQITPCDTASMSNIIYIVIDGGLLPEECWVVIEDVPR